MSLIGTKRSHEEQNDDERDKAISLLQSQLHLITQERNFLNGQLKDTKEKVKALQVEKAELQITNTNLATIIKVNGPELVCYDCFFGAAEFKHIKEHWRATKHGPYGIRDDGRYNCTICGESVRNLLQHQHSKHPETFQYEAVRAFHLRERMVKNGASAVTFPRKMYGTIFAAGIRSCENVLKHRKRQRHKSAIQEGSLEDTSGQIATESGILAPEGSQLNDREGYTLPYPHEEISSVFPLDLIDLDDFTYFTDAN